MVMIRFPVVFVILMKDEYNNTFYREKYDSLADARDDMERLGWEHPYAQVILMRKEGEFVQVLYTRNPMRV